MRLTQPRTQGQGCPCFPPALCGGSLRLGSDRPLGPYSHCVKPHRRLWYGTVMVRRALTAALAMLLACPVSAPTVLYTCSIDGVTRTSCCCNKAARHTCCSSRSGSAGCCDVSIQGTDSEGLRSALPSVPTPLAAMLNAGAVLQLRGVWTSRHVPPSSLPLALGPPLFVQKSAYLL